MEKRILITGGAGFIGSNFINLFLQKHQNYRVINLDKLTYAADLENNQEVKDHPNYQFIKGDICDRNHLEDIFSSHNITDVIHLAAESHVDNSISGPESFINTNINGTFTLLDVARNSWMEGPGIYKEGYENSKFLHISTDEVYGSLGETGLFTENTPFAPNSPYSASKASSDLLVRSFYKTYGMQVLTSNCSNNYGPNQHGEKLIPTIIAKAMAKESIPIYGDGKNIRDWLFVSDHCEALNVIFHNGQPGETYNIGGNSEKDNLYIANQICNILDALSPSADGFSHKELITFVPDRPGHDRRYAVDASKLAKELGWEPKEKFENGLIKTVKWYIDKYRKELIATYS